MRPIARERAPHDCRWVPAGVQSALAAARMAFRRLPGPPSYTLAVSLPVSGAALLRVVHLRSAVCMLGRFPALAGADLEVEAGEIVLLAGANGAGKTTLLRLCAGLLPLRSGHTEVLGVDLAVDRRAMRRCSLALVGHETFCYDDLTVQENIRFATRRRGPFGRGCRRHARTPRSRSRRPAPRTVVSRRDSGATSRSRSRSPGIPRLLLLDEPHAGLDERAGPCSTRSCGLPRPKVAPCCFVARVRRGPAGRDTRDPDRGGSGARAAGEPGPGPAPGGGVGVNFFKEAMLVAGKDLRIERRSRVSARADPPVRRHRGGDVSRFTLDADRTSLPIATPGLFWAAVFLAALLTIGRSFTVEEANRAHDGLRLSGLDRGALFVGEACPAMATYWFRYGFVVNREICSKRLAKRTFHTRTGGGDDPCAVLLGELDRGRANAARSAMHEQGLAGCKPAACKHIVEDREIIFRKSRRSDNPQNFRHRQTEHGMG